LEELTGGIPMTMLTIKDLPIYVKIEDDPDAYDIYEMDEEARENYGGEGPKSWNYIHISASTTFLAKEFHYSIGGIECHFEDRYDRGETKDYYRETMEALIDELFDQMCDYHEKVRDLIGAAPKGEDLNLESFVLKDASKTETWVFEMLVKPPLKFAKVEVST